MCGLSFVDDPWVLFVSVMCVAVAGLMFKYLVLLMRDKIGKVHATMLWMVTVGIGLLGVGLLEAYTGTTGFYRCLLLGASCIALGCAGAIIDWLRVLKYGHHAVEGTSA